MTDLIITSVVGGIVLLLLLFSRKLGSVVQRLEPERRTAYYPKTKELTQLLALVGQLDLESKCRVGQAMTGGRVRLYLDADSQGVVLRGVVYDDADLVEEIRHDRSVG